MTIQFLRGGTFSNDSYTGPVGSFTIDTEANNIRLHDGVTVGGFIIPNINSLNKGDVGLLNVENYPIATLSEAIEGTSTTTYLTPALTTELAIALIASGSITIDYGVF